jgi:hypothetical protein
MGRQHARQQGACQRHSGRPAGYPSEGFPIQSGPAATLAAKVRVRTPEALHPSPLTSDVPAAFDEGVTADRAAVVRTWSAFRLVKAWSRRSATSSRLSANSPFRDWRLSVYSAVGARRVRREARTGPSQRRSQSATWLRGRVPGDGRCDRTGQIQRIRERVWQRRP